VYLLAFCDDLLTVTFCRFLSVFVEFFEGCLIVELWCCYLLHGGGKEEGLMRNIVAFISSVMAGIVANFISKWLDRRK